MYEYFTVEYCVVLCGMHLPSCQADFQPHFPKILITRIFLHFRGYKIVFYVLFFFVGHCVCLCVAETHSIISCMHIRNCNRGCLIKCITHKNIVQILCAFVECCSRTGWPQWYTDRHSSKPSVRVAQFTAHLSAWCHCTPNTQTIYFFFVFLFRIIWRMLWRPL